MRLAALLILASAVTAHAGEITIERRPTVDLKAVFATVESLHETQARARIGGTVSSLSVEEGQQVDAGQVIAGISDAKIALQTAGADARIASAESELQLARTEYQRATELLAVGAGTKSRLETARTKLEVAERTVTALRSERGVLAEHGGEGAVLAPNNGRVLKVRVTTGSVVLPGEAIADIAVENYVLRVRLPERHARSIKAGDTVQVGPRALNAADSPPRTGTVRKVYPRIEDGRVIADIDVDGLGDYFVGERVPVHVATGRRDAYVIPREAVHRRLGLDTVTLKDGGDVVVQLGQIGADGVEVLAGLRDGDQVVW